jgi:hypothetical protein
MILAPVLYAAGSNPITVGVSPALFSANVSATSGTTSSVATLTISGGVAPYTAVWTSDNPNVSATSPTSITTSAFDWINLPSLFDTEFASITIDVSDSAGNSGLYVYSVVITRTS